MPSRYTLPDPQPNQPYIHVSALEAGILQLILQKFIAGAQPGESTICPSLAFSLRHSVNNEQLVFDLGIRKNMDAFPPAVQKSIAGRLITTPQSVDESLRKGGIDPVDVKTIIVSHLHYDHVGDSSAFPNAIFIMGGDAEAFLAHTYPANPVSNVLQSSIPLSRTRFLTSEFSESIGPFPRAYDYFGDGSMYVVDAAGHLPGHVNILARTNATGSWIYLAGDTAHDMQLLTGKREVAFSFDGAGHMVCAHTDKEKAVEHIGRVRELLDMARVQVLLAHDYVWYEANKGGDAFLPGTIPPKV
ncbi:Metallo-hydrolase/oxidoreductase [Daedaleopsis nitida]|nr:Metallo-hydrolase/oxidoreductase [Daedaleopsis nitida]